MIKEMDRVKLSGQMDQVMKEDGQTENRMGLENKFGLVEKFKKVNGSTVYISQKIELKLLKTISYEAK